MDKSSNHIFLLTVHNPGCNKKQMAFTTHDKALEYLDKNVDKLTRGKLKEVDVIQFTSTTYLKVGEVGIELAPLSVDPVW